MKLVGVDVYVRSDNLPDLPKSVGPLQLLLISNRGTRVYPPPAPKIEFINWFRCRFLGTSDIKNSDIDNLLSTLSQTFTWTKVEKLYEIDGNKGYSEPY